MNNNEDAILAVDFAEQYGNDPASEILTRGYRQTQEYVEQARNENHKEEYIQDIKQKMEGMVQFRYQEKVQQLSEAAKKKKADLVDRYYKERARNADRERIETDDLRFKYTAMPVEHREQLVNDFVDGKKDLSHHELKVLHGLVGKDSQRLLEINIGGGKMPGTGITIEGRPELAEPALQDKDIKAAHDEAKFYEGVPQGHFKAKVGPDGPYELWPFSKLFN